MTWLAAWALARRTGAGVLSFLSGLSLWQLATIASLVLAAVQYMHARHWHKVADQREKQSLALKNELQRISTAKNDQKAETQTRIVTVTRTIKAADDKASQIENAPLPGNCKTPPAILQADL